MRVRGGDARAQLARELRGFVGGKTPDAAQQAAQILAVDVLHRKIRLAVHLADVVNAADVLMRNLARDANLVVETGQQVHVVPGRFREKLQRDRLAQDEIVGPKNLAHPAFAEAGDDSIPAGQKGAGRKPLVQVTVEAGDGRPGSARLLFRSVRGRLS